MEHSCAIDDDDGDDTADDDWDSDPEDAAHAPSCSIAQGLSRPTSCFGNHWPLPAETVQQPKFGKPPHRLEASVEAVKLERSSSSSPLDHPMTDVTDPSAVYYIPTSNGASRKPPPVRTQALQAYHGLPIAHQYSNESPMETFQSPTSLGSPDAYAQFPSQPGSIHSQSMYLSQPRYNTYPQPPRVHDIRLDDPLQITQQQTNDVSPSMSQYPNGAEPLSAQDNRFTMDTSPSEDKLQTYLSPVSVSQAHYQDPQANMIANLRFHPMTMNGYPSGFGPVPDWYTNIKPEETWPGYDLPSDRVQGV